MGGLRQRQTTEVRYNLDSSGFSQAFSENDTVMLSSLSVGLHHVLVRANDSAGNTQEVLVTFGVDVAGPTIVASHDLGRCGPTKRSTPSPGTSPTPTAVLNVFHSTKAGPSSLRT